MDPDLTEEQEAVARREQILHREVTGERCRAVEDGDTGVDAALWSTARGGLLARASSSPSAAPATARSRRPCCCRSRPGDSPDPACRP